MRFAVDTASGFAPPWSAGDDFVQADPHKRAAVSKTAVSLDTALQHAHSVDLGFDADMALVGDEQICHPID